MPETRLVPMTREERDALLSAARNLPGTLEQEYLQSVVAAWDAAPQDPAAAAAGGIANSKGRTASSRNDDDRKAAKAVLRQLGWTDDA